MSTPTEPVPSFTTDPIKAYFLGTAWERAWSLADGHVRDMNYLLNTEGGPLHQYNSSLFESMLEGDMISARIHASMWLVAGHLDGVQQPNTTSVRRVWAQMTVMEAVIGEMTVAELRAADLLALNADLGYMQMESYLVHQLSMLRAPGAHELNAIICSRVLAQPNTIRFLPTRLRAPAEKVMGARAPGVLAAARLGNRSRTVIRLLLEKFDWPDVAARVATGPPELSDNEFFALGDYGFNRRGPLNGDPPVDYVATHTATTSDISAADEIPGLLN